jgi:putative two-component system response regulator
MTGDEGGDVLIVDDEAENLKLISAILKRGGVTPRPVMSGKLAIEAAMMDPPDLILLDMRMPGMSGLEVCQWLKQNDNLHGIPVIFISGLLDIEEKIEAFRVGAVDYISKPFQEQEVLARVKTHLSLRQLQMDLISQNSRLARRIAEQVKEATASQLATIFALAKLAETRDDDTGKHIERVQACAKRLAERMQKENPHAARLTSAFIDGLSQTAALHDIGKVGIPDSILLKPGQLTAQEFSQMKKHCELGANTLATVLKKFPDNHFLAMGVDVARSHHEKWDGSGYPDGLKGAVIPLSARIVALADFYDALTSNRCYRPAFSHEDARKMVNEGAGTHFDPEIVSAFNAVAERFQHIKVE